ncbi:MAG TPA: Fic family protein [bacterium]|nr:Fic family protein [bacterium]
MKIIDKLLLIKKEKDLTQEKLGQFFGVSFATINSWLNNRSTPRFKKEQLIDEIYKKVTGQTQIPQNLLIAKKHLLIKKSRNFNIVKKIKNRQDIYDQFILSLTYHTNSLEGSTLTQDDTAAILFDNISLPNKSLTDQLEAKNHQTALEFLFSEIKPNLIISEQYILKLHSILMNSIRSDAGVYRNHGVRIVGANVPTANYLKIPYLMEELIKEINRNEKDIVEHTTRIHSRFEQIHPFSDGNGRIGRLIIQTMLLRKNLPPAIIHQKDKRLYNKYLNKSQTETDNSLLQEFLCDAIMAGFKLLTTK